MDPLDQMIAQKLQDHKLGQIFRTDRNVCDLTSDLCAVTDSDPYICAESAGGIIVRLRP